MRPFVMNSNICVNSADIADYETFMNTVAGNTGNSYITYALLKELGCSLSGLLHIPSIYTYDFRNAERDLDIVNNECTHFILVLQDQIRIHESYGLQLPYRQLLDFISRVKKPILIAGLGANSLLGYVPRFHESLSPELISFLRALAGCVRTIGIRGYYTAEILDAIGVRNYAVIGCPSYYETGRGRVIEKKPWSEDLRVAVSSSVLKSWLQHKDVRVYLQDRQPQEERLIQHLAYGKPLECSELERTLLSEDRIGIYSSIGEWKDSMRQNDFFAGYRVHGSILALNSGVPAVVVNGDSRAREMCEFLNIPYFPCKSNAPLCEVYDLCDYGRMNLEYNRKYDAFKSFVEDQGFVLDAHEPGNGISLPLKSEPDLMTISSAVPIVYRTKSQSSKTEKLLELVLVTYNRAECVRETLKQLCDEHSPVRDCQITVLDNHSTDGTADVVAEFAATFPNIRLVSRSRNIGGNGNIARAMEIASKQYCWILGDDDYFDFSNWREVEEAMVRGEKAICLSRYILPDERKGDVAWQLVQATFITGMIVNADLFTDTVVTEAYNHIHTMFPQIVPIMHLINGGGHVYVVSKAVAFNGDDGTHAVKKDLSFVRGMQECDTSPYTRYKEWVHGWSLACAILKDKSVREAAFMRGMTFIYGSVENALHLFEEAGIRRWGDGVLPLLAAIAVQVPDSLRWDFFQLIRYRGDDSRNVETSLEGTRQELEACYRKLCKTPDVQSMVEWYRSSRMSEWPIGRLVVIFGWHLIKWLNPFSSLHREIRNRKRMQGPSVK